ncbi:TetR/AcrR family transcriptional regulator [Actinospica durhamensis]|uniref:TetR/AcrR family transcriptional regulator n=1 Tax=Actinospica durhamensis TaxID=1508375 RepID=UPI0027DE9E1A|nr:TetR/AcrR family transcriptional regulator [Actinospica durhamensis]
MTASSVTEHAHTGEAAGPLRLPGGRDGRDPERAIKRGPSRVPRELVLATQRDRLYDGLVRTVAEHGYANATVTDICRAAGVTRPAFYEHFDGKEGAFLAAYTHGTDLLLDVLDQAYAAHAGGWRSAVWENLEILLEVLAGAPAFAAMAIVEIEAAGPAARRRRVELLHRFRRFFAEAPEPPGPVDRAELIDTVIGGVYSAIYQRISAGRAVALPELKPVLAYFVTAPFGLADAQPPRLGSGPRPKVVLPCLPLFLAADQHSETDVNSDG